MEMPAAIEMIERLIASDHAYAADGDVYFSVRSFPSYGKLSGRNIDDLRSGERTSLSAPDRNANATSVAWSPDGARLAVACGGRRVTTGVPTKLDGLLRRPI